MPSNTFDTLPRLEHFFDPKGGIKYLYCCIQNSPYYQRTNGWKEVEAVRAFEVDGILYLMIGEALRPGDPGENTAAFSGVILPNVTVAGELDDLVSLVWIPLSKGKPRLAILARRIDRRCFRI